LFSSEQLEKLFRQCGFSQLDFYLLHLGVPCSDQRYSGPSFWELSLLSLYLKRKSISGIARFGAESLTYLRRRECISRTRCSRPACPREVGENSLRRLR